MGYYTKYSLEIHKGRILSDVDKKELAELEKTLKNTKSKYVKDELEKTIAAIKGQLTDDPEEMVEKFMETLYPEGGWNPFEDNCKWYNHDKDMKAFSLEYPEIVFKLHGEGEESGDIWDKYYKNGKVQLVKARIVYDQYDESKLV